MATPNLRDHIRKRGMAILTQKIQLQNNMYLNPITSGQDAKRIYYPIGNTKVSPQQNLHIASSYINHKTDQQVYLLNNSRTGGLTTAARNIKPTLIHPRELQARGLRINPTTYAHNPVTSKKPLAQVGDPIIRR